jgi:hypothetical protein
MDDSKIPGKSFLFTQNLNSASEAQHSATPNDTATEWDAHRSSFTHHYISEDKPLKEVMQIMASRFGFRAT